MELTVNEEEIIKFLREAKPYEKIEIQKDSSGKPDYYIISKSQKIILKWHLTERLGILKPQNGQRYIRIYKNRGN